MLIRNVKFINYDEINTYFLKFYLGYSFSVNKKQAGDNNCPFDFTSYASHLFSWC